MIVIGPALIMLERNVFEWQGDQAILPEYINQDSSAFQAWTFSQFDDKPQPVTQGFQSLQYTVTLFL